MFDLSHFVIFFVFTVPLFVLGAVSESISHITNLTTVVLRTARGPVSPFVPSSVLAPSFL